MPELYLLILSVLAITAIVGRRQWVSAKEHHREFRREVKKTVDLLKKEELKQTGRRFRESLNENRIRGDFAKYKTEMKRAEMAVAKRQWKEAKQILIQALSMTSEPTPTALLLAQTYAESGDVNRAEILYRSLLEKNPRNPDIFESLGRIYAKEKRYRDAVQAYARAVELDEKNDRTFLALGKLYHLLMRYSLAAECFRRAAELKPREVNYLFLLAEACREDADLDNALYTYERVLALEPYNEAAKHAAQDVRMKIKENETNHVLT